jgi:hypothetical protein
MPPCGRAWATAVNSCIAAMGTLLASYNAFGSAPNFETRRSHRMAEGKVLLEIQYCVP